MSFSDLFDSEFKQRNKGHFASIVRLALDEFFALKKRVLDKLALDLKFLLQNEEILENPTNYQLTLLT
jgi:hypothetical protein